MFAMFTLRELAAETQHAAAEYRISGPFTHDNLSVFLIHGVARQVKPLLSLEKRSRSTRSSSMKHAT